MEDNTSLTDQLRKLADLRKEGSLSEEEFIDAKRKLLAGYKGPPPLAPGEGEASDAEPEARTYYSSRWSAGNRFYRDSITLAPDGVVFRKSRLIGSSEEHINYQAIASIRIRNRAFLSDLSIETSGGSQPIFINGLWKSDAQAVQDSIRAFQRGG